MKRNFDIRECEIEGVYSIMPFYVEDDRGSLNKFFSKELFGNNGIDFKPVEAMDILSRRNVIRGLHFQRVVGQPKLLRCVSGKVWCAVVDINPERKTFGRWISVDINGGNGILIPGDCAFGSLALEDSIISSICGERYCAEYDCGIRWDDPDIGVSWPLELIDHLELSEKDSNLSSFKMYKEGYVE